MGDIIDIKTKQKIKSQQPKQKPRCRYCGGPTVLVTDRSDNLVRVCSHCKSRQ